MIPKISVIIPVYNPGKKLIKTLKSIQNQSFSNFKCLLIDDGSTDKVTLNILTKISQSDNRFIVYSKHNEGIEKTRLFGVKKATTELLMFCDHDDYYERNALEVLYKAFLNSDADIVSGNCWSQRFYYINLFRKTIVPFVNENLLIDNRKFNESYFVNFFGINKFPVSTWGKLYKKHLFKSEIQIFGVNFMEDVLINSQVFNSAKSIQFIPDFIYTHIYGGLSTNFNFEQVFTGYDKVYLFRKQNLLNNNLDFKSLLVEFKNVVIQNINLLIDNKVNLEEFTEKMNLIVSKDIFKDVLKGLSINEKGEYINLLEDNKIEVLYNKAKSRYGWKRKSKHIMKKIIRKI